MAVERHGSSVGAVCFLPLDADAGAIAPELASAVSRRLNVGCRLLPQAELVSWPLLDGREQLDADELLAELETRRLDLAGGDHVLVGITDHDIGSLLFTHFFGRARMGGTTALVSTARLTPVFYGLRDDERLTRRRAEAEVVHELGHLFGLAHCPEPDCVMRFAPSVEAVDLRGGEFCASCAGRLPRGMEARRAV